MKEAYKSSITAKLNYGGFWNFKDEDVNADEPNPREIAEFIKSQLAGVKPEENNPLYYESLVEFSASQLKRFASELTDPRLEVIAKTLLEMSTSIEINQFYALLEQTAKYIETNNPELGKSLDGIIEQLQFVRNQKMDTTEDNPARSYKPM